MSFLRKIIQFMEDIILIDVNKVLKIGVISVLKFLDGEIELKNKVI